MSKKSFLAFLLFFIFASALSAFSQGEPAFNGDWSLVSVKSTDIDLYGTLSISIHQNGPAVTIIQTWGAGRSFKDTLALKTGGTVNRVPVKSRVFPSNVFMGLSMIPGEYRELVANWGDKGKLLTVDETFSIRGSQGPTKVSSRNTYELSSDNEVLTYTVHRSTRPGEPPMKFVLKPAGSAQAYVMKIEDNWEIKGKLPEQAFLISLQGVSNTDGPNLYFIYPDNWPFTYTASVFDFYRNKRNYTFTELKTPEAALQALKSHVKGYVVWDTDVRTSLIVAFTVAGLEKAIVVSEALIPLAEKYGLKPVADFRGKFKGQSDAQIYSWAYEQYGKRCSKDFIVWLGGESGNVMKPAVADWGIYKKVFFNDLSCRVTDVEEYALAKKILGDMKPMSMVMGWHSYGKDLEREFVTLTSSFGDRVEGLHTLPNLSFSSQIPVSAGFKFKNKNNLIPGKKYIPEKKVYVTCIQTDGIGLGAWLKPGRGDIPYGWECIMSYVWMAPGMLEYFYSMATPNDYFLGCLSGPGYLYPKAVPPNLLPKLITLAQDEMKQLDLSVFEIMDYSEGATVEGNTELPRRVVDAYYKGMPDAIGFVNGYAPAHTFTVQNGRPFISFDYYLSPERPEADAVADLRELAAVNAKRPYFLLVHVRESSDVKRVKGILDKLGSDFEVVPLDIFLKLAGEAPTYQERFLERSGK